MERDKVTVFLKGMWVGGTMTVPGVSGGSMAMILGVYDRLLRAVAGSLRGSGESMGFLLRFGAGGALGMLLFSRLITLLLQGSFGVVARYFFLGAVAGGVPLIVRKAGAGQRGMGGRGRRLEGMGYPLLGMLLVWLLSLLPPGLFVAQRGGISGFFFQLSGGLLLAVGLVLPGISISQLLYLLGLYEAALTGISTLKLLPLLPLGMGLLLGTLLTVGLFERLLVRCPKPAYLTILGFVLASLPELFPGLPGGRSLAASLLAAGAGFGLVYAVTKKELY